MRGVTMFGILSSCVLSLLVTSVAQIPKEPDFSGEWVLVQASSTASDPASTLTVRQRITRTTMRGEPMTPYFSDLTVDRHFKSGVESESYKIGIVGGTVGGVARGAASPQGEWTTVGVVWEGESLIIRTGTYPGPPRESAPSTEHEEAWSFDPSGRLLITITDRSSGSQAATVTLVYRRRSNPVALEPARRSISMLTVALLLSQAAPAPRALSTPAIRADPQESNDLKLDTRIPAADRQKYHSIRDAKDWENPSLVVLKDGVDVRAKGYRRTLPVSELRQVLVALPVSAWPYGAVVAVQEMHLRAVGGADDAAIKANLDDTLAALKALKVHADLWP
jgi:hypothetical protein